VLGDKVSVEIRACTISFKITGDSYEVTL